MRLSIILPIHNISYPLCHYTGNALGSVKYFTFTPPEEREIIVVDNASTVELGGLKWNEVVDEYIRNEENVGVAKSWNQGIAASKGEYIAVINSDIQVFEYWDNLMMEALQHVELVMATPMYDAPFGRVVEAKKRRKEWVGKDQNKYLSDFADFSCFMMRRSTYDAVGPFDENYDIGYGEDVDYRMRMEAMGMVCKSDKRVAIHHVGMATGHAMEGNGLDLGKVMDKNREYTKKKHNLDEYGVPQKDQEQPEEKPDQDDDRYVVRTKRTGDKVYLIEDGTAAWVKNPETLEELGFNFGQVKIIPHKEFQEFEREEPIDLRAQVRERINEVKAGMEAADKNKVLGYRENAEI